MIRAEPVELAVRTAAAIVTERGIDASGPRVLSTRQAVIVHFAPAPDRPVQPLHGDAHIWNTMQTRAGPLWFDFDEVLWLAVDSHRHPGGRDELEHVLAWLRPRVA